MLCGVLLIGACSEGDDDTKPTDTTPAAVTTEPSTSDTDATDTTLGVPEGSTEGISDTEINIAYVYSDTKVLQEAGLVPNTGDPYQHVCRQGEQRGRRERFAAQRHQPQLWGRRSGDGPDAGLHQRHRG